MELIKIINARQVLDNMSGDKKIGSHLAYWMAKFIVKTESEYTFYMNEMRKLCDTYATHKDDGTILIPTEKTAEFSEALETLNKTDVEDPGIRFKLSELSTELKLSMKQMYPLLDFVDEEK